MRRTGCSGEHAAPPAAATLLPPPLLTLCLGSADCTWCACNLRRSEALDRFAVINVQYQHLVDALRPLLRQFAAYPRSVNQARWLLGGTMHGRTMHACLAACAAHGYNNRLSQPSASQPSAGTDGTMTAGQGLFERPPNRLPPIPHRPQTNAPILPIMLATKLLPEMEAEEASLLAQLTAAQQPGGGAGADPGQPRALPVAEQFAWVQDQERQLNHLVDQLLREQGGPLGAKSERRRQLAAAVTQAAAAGAAASPPSQPPKQGLPQAAQPPDPLLAAVTSGVGL